MMRKSLESIWDKVCQSAEQCGEAAALDTEIKAIFCDADSTFIWTELNEPIIRHNSILETARAPKRFYTTFWRSMAMKLLDKKDIHILRRMQQGSKYVGASRRSLQLAHVDDASSSFAPINDICEEARAYQLHM